MPRRYEVITHVRQAGEVRGTTWKRGPRFDYNDAQFQAFREGMVTMGAYYVGSDSPMEVENVLGVRTMYTVRAYNSTRRAK
jgi:hypothetical protein